MKIKFLQFFRGGIALFFRVDLGAVFKALGGPLELGRHSTHLGAHLQHEVLGLPSSWHRELPQNRVHEYCKAAR